MSKASYASLKETSDKLDARWQREFAGRPRHTRDLAVLDKMIEKASAAVRKAKVLKGDAADQLKALASERLELYRRERAAIAEALFDKPEIAIVHDTGRAIDAIYAEWRRHFAGQDRRSRDLARLGGMVARLGEYEARLQSIMAVHPDLVKSEGLMDIGAQLQLFKDERVAIEASREAATAKERLVAAFSEAQQALDRYRSHFAGQPRATCDPDMLLAIVTRLQHVLAILDKADPTAASELEGFETNRNTVRQQLELYQNELGLVRTARETAPPRDVGGLLAQAANRLFEVYQQNYAGQSRLTRDLKLLSELCDRLYDIEGQMRVVGDATADKVVKRNEEIVSERRRMYENEWVEIAKAKAAPPQGATPAETPKSTTAAAPSRPSSDNLIRIVD